MQRISVVKIEMKKERNLMVENKKVDNPKIARDIAYEYLKGADREYLVVLALDTKNKVNSITTVSVGSLNSTVVAPREVFKTLIESNAASFILIHNHPSGNVEPSKEDLNITDRINECGKIMGIEMYDHIIIGDYGTGDYTSLREKGCL